MSPVRLHTLGPSAIRRNAHIDCGPKGYTAEARGPKVSREKKAPRS